MSESRIRNFRRSSLALAAVVLVAACGSAPRNNAALDDARATYQLAAGDAQVVRSAPLELRKAQEALQRGEAALRADESVEAVNHYAYLAKRRSEVAREAAKVTEAEKAVADASTRRQAIVAEAERANAENARRLAEQRLAIAQASQTQAALASARARSLEQQLAEMKARQTERGMVLTLGDVLFDTGRAQLKPGAMRTLDQLATFLRENPQRTVEIEGYTDSVGSEDMNQALSERRANAVKSALMDRGIAINRIAARGFGEMNPVASNDTAAGRQQNRRVEVVISNK